MRRPIDLLPLSLVCLVLIGLFSFSAMVKAEHKEDPHTKDFHPLGHDIAPASLENPELGPPDIHTDIAFWGRYAIQGNWNGFRIIDIAAPGNPKLISFTRCEGDQGDVSVWGNLVFRSTNTPNPGGRMCDGQSVPLGFEGIHLFDISNPKDPVLITGVATACGSHTHTLVPDLGNNRVLIYNNASSASCPWMEIIEVPLGNPASASVIHMEPLFGSAMRCHDVAVFTAGVNLAVCASNAHANVFDISLDFHTRIFDNASGA